LVPIYYPLENEKFLSIIAKINDAYCIIAPETGQILQSIVRLVEKTEKISLNSDLQAIEKTANKTFFYETIQNLGITPKTEILNLADGLVENNRIIQKEIGYPVVLKPADGVGCSGVSLVTEDAQLGKAIEKIMSLCSSTRLVAQQFIQGETASVSLISTGKKAIALSLNKQNVILESPDSTSSYQGGSVPFDYWLRQKVFEVAEKVVEAFPGLKGYVGVDFILTEHKGYVVEINPRLTMSYTGLRKISNFNVVDAMIDAVLNCKLPPKVEKWGVACFSKIETSKPTIDVFRKACKMDAVISPPFPLEGVDKSFALIVGTGDTLDVARNHLEEAKKKLLDIII
jgi:predicted ATP-grasp superfamily ATP-dependent carboligase